MAARPGGSVDVGVLSARIAEMEEVLGAIAGGGVDAVIAGEPGAGQVYTLASADRPYRLILTEMNEGAATVSEYGTVTFANPYLARMLGRDPGRLVGTPAGDLVVAADRPVLARLLALRPGEHAREEARLAAPGGPLPVILATSCLDLDGMAVRCLVVTDLTAQKEAADALLKAANARLEAANAELEAANDQLDAFATSVAHDLRAPLRAIGGYSQILLSEHAGELSPGAVTALARVEAGAEHMNELIDDLLAFARTGRAALDIRPVDMAALVSSVVAELRRGDGGRPVAVRVGDLAPAAGDARLLHQVWENLLSNAFKFTAGRPDPEIEVVSEAGDGEVVYHVSDNGAGFDMAYAAKLFGMFERLHGPEYPGTGIGLAIVARIVDRHGGRVWGRGEVGRGARFSFALPAAPADSGRPDGKRA